MTIIDFEETKERRTVKTYFVVVVYDVSDDKKRYRIHKAMKGFGEWVQRSAFECHLKDNQIEAMKAKLKRYIDPKVDMLRIYKISHIPRVWTYGRVELTEDEKFAII